VAVVGASAIAADAMVFDCAWQHIEAADMSDRIIMDQEFFTIMQN
jgi:hypothetical protein